MSISIDVIDGIVTAGATAVIAIYTIVLARVSKRQSNLIADQIKLAREEFIATHRPRLMLRRFYLKDIVLTEGQAPSIIFMIQNIGDSAGRVVEIRSATVVLGPGELLLPNMGFGFTEPFNVSLRSGQSEIFPVNGSSPLEKEERMWVPQGKKTLFCLGVVIYLDEMDNRREIGFCRRYDAIHKRWDKTDNSEYEYEF